MMDKQEKQVTILTKIEAMVDAWNQGDIAQSQKEYEYVMGWCESAGYDFGTTIKDGISLLQSRCVGVQDTAKYNRYLKGI